MIQDCCAARPPRGTMATRKCEGAELLTYEATTHTPARGYCDNPQLRSLCARHLSVSRTRPGCRDYAVWLAHA
eukprot:362936-Chlamydomonas_euryale.AAC.3